MTETYTNHAPFEVEIPRYLLRLAPGATFTVPDDDLGTLANQPWFANPFTVTDNGDGTFTITGPTITDNGNGTFTTTGTVTDNGDGTFNLGA